MKETAGKGKRLVSLDILRGADMFLLTVVGPFVWALVPVIPPIKHIYTLSFTAQAMGWSMLALAALYALFDMRLASSAAAGRAVSSLVLFGRASLLAYMCMEVFNPAFAAFGNMFAPGFAHAFGKWAGPLAGWLASSALLVAVLKTRVDALSFRRSAR